MARNRVGEIPAGQQCPRQELNLGFGLRRVACESDTLQGRWEAGGRRREEKVRNNVTNHKHTTVLVLPHASSLQPPASSLFIAGPGVAPDSSGL